MVGIWGKFVPAGPPFKPGEKKKKYYAIFTPDVDMLPAALVELMEEEKEVLQDLKHWLWFLATKGMEENLTQQLLWV